MNVSMDTVIFELSPVKDWKPNWSNPPTPALHADFWFPAGPDTVQPMRGKVSLFVKVPGHCYGGYGEYSPEGNSSILDPIAVRLLPALQRSTSLAR